MIAWATFVSSLLVTGCLTPVCGAWASRRGWVDRPNAIKIHRNPIPYLGGVAIFGGVLVGVLFGILRSPMPQKPGAMGIAILAGLSLSAGLGLWDDVRDLSPWLRLAGQAVAAALVVGQGLWFNLFPGVGANAALTVLYIMSCCNAMNLMDGMDGLAAGLCAIAAAFYALISWSSGSVFGMALSLSLMGSGIAFLRYNFHPASIFMGDAGSLSLGYGLAVASLMLSRAGEGLAQKAAPVVILALPLADAAWAFLRRILERRSPFAGDRRHSYDLLLQRGHTQSRVAWRFYLWSAGIGTVGLALRRFG